jgi:hypothetical protein
MPKRENNLSAFFNPIFLSTDLLTIFQSDPAQNYSQGPVDPDQFSIRVTVAIKNFASRFD